MKKPTKTFEFIEENSPEEIAKMFREVKNVDPDRFWGVVRKLEEAVATEYPSGGKYTGLRSIAVGIQLADVINTTTE